MPTIATAAPSTTVSSPAPIIPITESTLCALLTEVYERLANAEAANEILIGEIDSLNDRVALLQERAA